VLAACGGTIEPMAGLGLGGRSSGLITVREAQEEDVGACAVLAAAERADDPGLARARFQADLGMPERHLFVASVEGCFAGFGRTTHFIAPSGAPSNVAPEGYYVVGLLVDPGWRRRGVGLALTRARMAWAFERAGEVWFFANARNRASLDLHARLGFVEVTRDFAFPGVTFDGGVGVLCRAARGHPL
jgi:ribosomal protein S18 acetylase RimI-like enzyme